MPTVFVRTPSGLDNIQFRVGSSPKVGEEIEEELQRRLPQSVYSSTYVTSVGGLGRVFQETVPAASSDLFLQLNFRICGGKGGFGSMLRAQGGKMSRKKGTQNNDNFRTLDGKRVRQLRKAKELSTYMESAQEIQQKALEKKKEKYKAIVAAADRNQAESSRFNDSAYLDRNEELANDIRQSVNFIGEGSGPSASRQQAESGSGDQGSSRRSIDSSSSGSSSHPPIMKGKRQPKAHNFFDSESDPESDSD